MKTTLAVAGSAAILLTTLAFSPSFAQPDESVEQAGEARVQLEQARNLAIRARERGELFEAQVGEASAASDRAQAEAAALAARIQQSEAAIGLAEAELALIRAERRELDSDLARRRQPIVRLTAALQSFVRRPLTLSLLQPASLKETVYLSAVLDSTVPLVRERTGALRGDILQLRRLQSEAEEALTTRRMTERELAERRQQLVAVAARERVAARRAANAAASEEARAFALAEEARSLGALVEGLMEEDAARPASVLNANDPLAGPSGFRLPADGVLVSDDETGSASGIRLSVRPRAQIVAPFRGRVVFAGPYRGFGRIVIVEHPEGWTGLVTNIGELAVATGQNVLAGSPIGIASAANTPIGLELRRSGRLVDPLAYLGR